MDDRTLCESSFCARTAHKSAYAPARAEAFAALIDSAAKTSAHLAAFVGEAYGRFQHIQLEGERFRVYTLDLGNRILLAMVTRADTPIGLARLQAKAVGAEILKMLR